MQLISSIDVGGTIDAVVFEPFSHTIFAFNTHSKTVAVIDATSHRIRATIPLPGRPTGAVADQKGAVLVNLVSTGQLARIDAKTQTIAAVWSLSPCVGPSGLAIDSVGSRTFSACENEKIVIADTESGKVVAAVPVGEGATSVAFDPKRKAVLSANADGSLTVIGEGPRNSFSVLQTLATQAGARTMAFDSGDGRAYLVGARFGQRSGPTSEELQYRPTPVPGSATVLVIEGQ
jgi:DNA-binding beta-propeller fold protein YncE